MNDRSLIAAPTTSQRLLARLLDTPDLAPRVQALAPAALCKLIERVGLEDAGEVLAFATPAQLTAVLDEDLWRDDETFDPARFVTWLEVLLESGDRFVAERLAELPEELVTLAFERCLLVVDMDALVTELAGRDGDEVDRIEKALADGPCEELEQYRIIARRADGWDAVLAAVLALDRDHHALLARILERCAAATADRGDLVTALTTAETIEADAAADREDRRAAAGHVAPSLAKAFLEHARRDGDWRTRDPSTRAYFRALPTIHARAHAPQAHARAHDLPALSSPSAAEPAMLAALRDLAARDRPAFDARSAELAYLANVLVAAQKLRPAAALEAALAVCSRGLALAGDADLATVPADALFRLAWHHPPA